MSAYSIEEEHQKPKVLKRQTASVINYLLSDREQEHIYTDANGDVILKSYGAINGIYKYALVICEIPWHTIPIVGEVTSYENENFHIVDIGKLFIQVDEIIFSENSKVEAIDWCRECEIEECRWNENDIFTYYLATLWGVSWTSIPTNRLSWTSCRWKDLFQMQGVFQVLIPNFFGQTFTFILYIYIERLIITFIVPEVEQPIQFSKLRSKWLRSMIEIVKDTPEDSERLSRLFHYPFYLTKSEMSNGVDNEFLVLKIY